MLVNVEIILTKCCYFFHNNKNVIEISNTSGNKTTDSPIFSSKSCINSENSLKFSD